MKRVLLRIGRVGNPGCNLSTGGGSVMSSYETGKCDSNSGGLHRAVEHRAGLLGESILAVAHHIRRGQPRPIGIHGLLPRRNHLPQTRRGERRRRMLFLTICLLIGGALGAALGYFGQCTSGACPLTSTWWRGALYGATMGLVFFALSGRHGSAP